MLMRRLGGLALAATLALLAACNTMQGLGQDIERGGQKLQDKAKN
jgi:predicted small secreted protein